MYSMVCRSMDNYARSFSYDASDVRYVRMLFLYLIEDQSAYEIHKRNNTDLYQELSHFLWSISGCERCGQFLHELSMLDIEGEHCLSGADFTEQHKVLHMFYELAYF